MSSVPFTHLAAILSLWITYRYFAWFKESSNLTKAVPPGPTPRFLVNNLFDLPRKNMSTVFMSWTQKYNSNILFAHAMGRKLLILNKREDADELLERRSKIYSSRKFNKELWKILSLDTQTPSLVYGEELREHRRFYHDHLRPSVLPSHSSLISDGVHTLLRSMMKTPDDFLHHLKLLSIWLPLRLMYGYDAASVHDPAIAAAEKSGVIFLKYMRPGSIYAIMGDRINKLPDWMPGKEFRRDVKLLKVYTDEAKRIPWEFAQKAYGTGTLPHCVLSEVLREGTEQPGVEKKLDVALAAAHTAYAAASDTVLSVSRALVYALVKFPHVQRKLQQVLEQHLGHGPGRLPTLEDRPFLPYVEAFVREALRWRAPVPLGIPHSPIQDDHYKGYLIPKESSIFPNVHAMSIDEEFYPFPEEFRPERFLTPEGGLTTDDVSFVFGFGRRACPGKFFAMDTLWLTTACVATAFNLSAKKDASGKEMSLSIGMNDLGLIKMTQDFECDITLRSEAVKGLLAVPK